MSDENEPYIIRAGDFDPETHERQRHYANYANVVEWTSQGGFPGWEDVLIVVRNKPKPEPRYYVNKDKDKLGRPYINDRLENDETIGVIWDENEARAYADWRNSREDMQ